MGAKSMLKSKLTKLNILKRGLKYRHIVNYVDIDGWLSINEAIELYNMAESLPMNSPVVVEIGSWLGKSTLVLAKGLKNKHSPKLYCIDPFNADGDDPSAVIYAKRMDSIEISLAEKFIHNMKKNHVFGIVETLQGYSYDFVNGFSKTIDLLFIDGNHEYEAVLRDFLDWSSLVKPQGIIAFHDVTKKKGCEGPWLVTERYIRGNPQWKDLKLVGTFFTAKKN